MSGTVGKEFRVRLLINQGLVEMGGNEIRVSQKRAEELDASLERGL